MTKVDLNLYDDVNEFHRNWIDPKWSSFYSKTMPHKPLFTFLHKYDNKLDEHKYYIALANTLIEGHMWECTHCTNNYIKCNIANIWNKLPLEGITDIIEVNVELVEEDDVVSVYYIDI